MSGVSRFYEDAVESLFTENFPVLDLKISCFLATLRSDKNDHRGLFPSRYISGLFGKLDLINILNGLPDVKTIKTIVETNRKNLMDYDSVEILNWINLKFNKYFIEQVVNPFHVLKLLQQFENVLPEHVPDDCFRITLQDPLKEEIFCVLAPETELLILLGPVEEIYPLISKGWDASKTYFFSNNIKFCLSEMDFSKCWSSSLYGENIKCAAVVELPLTRPDNSGEAQRSNVREEEGSFLHNMSRFRYLLVYRQNGETFSNQIYVPRSLIFFAIGICSAAFMSFII